MYENSSRLQLSHGTVNHSLNFVDPATGIHTQAIESYWAKAKQKFKEMKGIFVDGIKFLIIFDEQHDL
jgi:hypothetical protein